MAPTHVKILEVFAFHEPEGRAGCPQPAANVANVLFGPRRGEDTAPYRAGFRVPTRAKKRKGLSMTRHSPSVTGLVHPLPTPQARPAWFRRRAGVWDAATCCCPQKRQATEGPKRQQAGALQTLARGKMALSASRRHETCGFLRLGMVLGLLLGIAPVRADNLQPSSTDAYHADPEQAAPGDELPQASPQGAQRRRDTGSGLVFKDQVTPHWFHNNTR